ncbi:MFS transporter [Bifidobacterium panos]|uniref:MFS transporter n=1 Tax=Bifidobacterium panos TaxID=2675321 RepID=A0ABX1SVW1_9BIFI|nr:MFS transporter [Bifidobacterium sp. DSM 109963]NMN01970.1 MFS transporter [Bifidobacterium sp. DSM 109963]
MKKSLLALASGAFILGAAEFVMMGILPQVADTMRVSIPFAGNYISAYAIGVCVGTLMLVFGRKIRPKRLVIVFMVIALVGNALSCFAPDSLTLIAARFISGLPHGAFFGTATLIAKTVADRGKEAQAVSLMVLGQTVANMLGVPAGTLLAEHVSWRMAFAVLAGWAVMTIALVTAWVPEVPAVEDKGLAGQFRFLTRRGPWVILAAVFVGNTGVFCWWSYVSKWLQAVGGWPSSLVPAMMALAGFGMVVGGLLGGKITDLWRAAGTASIGQMFSLIGLALVFLLPGNLVSTAILTFWIALGLFFISSPQQLLMVEAGAGGGELVAGAAVQVAFNAGNAVGSLVGGLALTCSGMNYHSIGLAGVPFAALAVALLAFYSIRCESDTDAINRLQRIDV